MAEESDDEKTEEPTPRRLEKAREEGQLPRSRELATFLLLAAGVGMLWLTGGWISDALLGVMRSGMGFDRAVATDETRLMALVWHQIWVTAAGMAPFFFALFVVSGLAPTLLGGLLFTSLKVDPKRMDPVKGIKKMFSSKVAAEFAKTIAKLGLTITISALFIYTHMYQILGFALAEGQGTILAVLKLVVQCCALMILAYIIVVLIDVPYQLWSHHKELRMSQDEVKKEHKEEEGDPEVQKRIKQKQQEMAQKRMMSKVADADVVVTNPTHYAIALSYQEQSMRAPHVVAKGSDEIAARIRERALDNGVPRLSAPPLARALYRYAPLDQEIPTALYAAVAEVLAWVYQLQNYRREGGEVPLAPSALDVPTELDETGATS